MRAELPAAVRRVELQAERGELDRDVAVEAARRDVGQGLLVRDDRRFGLVLARDVLAEHVERGHAALGVQAAHESRAPRRASRPRRSARRSGAPPPWAPAAGSARRAGSTDSRDLRIDRSMSVREARAKHQTVTAPAPERARRRAHSRAVAAEVATSSTSRTRRAGSPAHRERAAHVARARGGGQTALDLGLARLDEAPGRERQVQPPRQGRARGPRPGGIRAPAPARNVAGTAATSSTSARPRRLRHQTSASRAPR